MSKANINGKQHFTTTQAVMSGQLLFTSNGSGVLQYAYGSSTLTSCPDWTSLITLFEAFRVRGINHAYEPVTPHQVALSGASVASPLHVPMFSCYEPTSIATVPFTQLSSTQPFSEKRNKLNHTGKSQRWHYKVAPSMLSAVSGALIPTLGDWQGTGSLTTNIQGGVLMSALTMADNVTVVVGVNFLEFIVEFAWRQ